MHLTRIVRAIVSDGRGGKQWLEKSAKRLPPGDRPFHYSPWYFGSIVCSTGVFTYVILQMNLNPDSWYGRIGKNVMEYVTYDLEQATKKANEREAEAERKEKAKTDGPSTFTRMVVSLLNFSQKTRTTGTFYAEPTPPS